MKICFVGSHGTGKSSGSAYLASLLKRQYPEKSVIVLEENVRKVSRHLGGVINTPEFQKLTIVDQIARELEAESLHNVVICDRSTIDSLVYGASLSQSPPLEYCNLATKHMLTYSHIFFIRPDDENQAIVNDSFRLMNKDVRNKIDQHFDNFLRTLSENTEPLKFLKQIKTSEIFTYDYLTQLGVSK